MESFVIDMSTFYAKFWLVQSIIDPMTDKLNESRSNSITESFGYYAKSSIVLGLLGLKVYLIYLLMMHKI